MRTKIIGNQPPESSLQNLSSAFKVSVDIVDLIRHGITIVILVVLQSIRSPKQVEHHQLLLSNLYVLDN